MTDDTKPLTSTIEPLPNKETLKRAFDSKANAKEMTVWEFERILVKKIFPQIVPSPSIKVRNKNFESYYKKYQKHLRAGETRPKITDQMGLRVICPFLENMKHVVALIEKHFQIAEKEQKGRSFVREFGYESIHLLVNIPDSIVRLMGDTGCEVVEIQIRTTLQDAWAEVEHELFYKSEEFGPLDEPMQRKLHAVGANLTLADAIFQDIRDHQKKYSHQRMTQRGGFYEKVEDSIDAFILPRKPGCVEEAPPALLIDLENSSVDELLLHALTLHNKKRFEDTIAIYSWILNQESRPKPEILSVIHKHRGLSYFAQSKYAEALSDFTKALELDERPSYIPVYYRGLVYSVLGRYAEAINDYNRSLELNPYQFYALLRRGQAYYHLGDYLKALSDCDAAIAMEPENDVAGRFHEMIKAKLRL